MKLESASLTHREWLEIHEASLDFHRQTNLADLRLCILRRAKELIAADTASFCDNRGGFHRLPWLEISADAQRLQRTFTPAETGAGTMLITDFGRDNFADREALLRLWNSAPNVPDSSKAPHIRVQQFAQYHTAREFRKSQLYAECYAPVDQEMWIGVELGKNMLTVAVARRRAEFSAAEMLKLELLRPQIEIAYHRLLALGAAPAQNWTAALEKLLQAGLTRREAEVLHWLAEGKTNPEIAIILSLSRSTVKTHLEKIYAKLGCETRTAATRWVMETLAG